MNANFDWDSGVCACVWGGNLIGLSEETLKGFMGFIQMRFEVNSSLSSLKKKSVSECTAFKII